MMVRKQNRDFLGRMSTLLILLRSGASWLEDGRNHHQCCVSGSSLIEPQPTGMGLSPPGSTSQSMS